MPRKIHYLGGRLICEYIHCTLWCICCIFRICAIQMTLIIIVIIITKANHGHAQDLVLSKILSNLNFRKLFWCIFFVWKTQLNPATALQCTHSVVTAWMIFTTGSDWQKILTFMNMLVSVLLNWTTLKHSVPQQTISFLAKVLNNSDLVLQKLLPSPVVQNYNLEHKKT